MDTTKALLAGLVVTIGLLAASYGFEGIAQVLGPEEEDHAEETDDHGEVTDAQTEADPDAHTDEDVRDVDLTGEGDDEEG